MITIIYAAIVLGILIFVHELGHFLLAKRLGVGVLKFSLGFGPKLIGRKIGETEYLISAFPLGGYVKMVGEDPDEEVSPEDTSRSFSSKSAGKKIAIVAAGPIFNIAFAAVLFSLAFMVGVPTMTSEVGDAKEGFPAFEAGIKTGDKVVSIDGVHVSKWDEVSEAIQTSKKDIISVEVFRSGSTLRFEIRPKVTKVKTIFGEDTEIRVIGIGASKNHIIERSNPVEAVGKGIISTWNVTRLTLIGIVKLVQRIVPAETIGGPIMIAQMAGEQAQGGILSLLSFMALLSINLGVLNLLPVPILDGGHLTFFTIEAIIRRPLSHRFKEIAQQVGLFLLISLMAFAFYN
ncbi:MAG: RIP metalloprotease RseP, partial [Deltaproteobacteria bacterium]